MNHKLKPYFNLAIKFSISALLIGYLLYTQDVSSIINSLSHFKYSLLVPVLFLMFLGTFVSALRWQKILATSNYTVSVWLLYSLYIKGYLYSNFLPTQMGGDVYKALILGRKIQDNSTAVFSVFMDRFSGLVVLLALGIVGISSIYGTAGLILALIVLSAGLFLYLPILKFIDNYIGHKISFIRKFLNASDLLFNNKKEAVLIIGYSLLIQIISFSAAYLIFTGLNITLSLKDIFMYMPIASLSSLIPSFNGFGTQEAVYALLFSNAGVTNETAITASIIMHFCRLVLSITGGILILFGF